VDKPDIFVLQNAEYTCSICIPEIAVKADGANHKVSGNKKRGQASGRQDRAVYAPEGRQGGRRIHRDGVAGWEHF
jgi:hypothetical protein